MGIVVPHQSLRAETLQALIEEFVTRDGAVQGHIDTPLQDRIEQVRGQLVSGKAVIVFDAEEESCTICQIDAMPKPELHDRVTGEDEGAESDEP